MVRLKNNVLAVLLVSLLVAILLPHIIWRVSDYRDLSVLIVDKTVPDDTYREHKRLIYALNHFKYLNTDSQEYAEDSDYSGFLPLGDETYDIKDVSSSLKEDSDLIYVADTYGVYSEEFFQRDISGERSEKIYGGLEVEEVELMKSQIYEKQTPLVAEFNTFGSPSSEDSKAQLTELLGINWSGWIGRYFEDLDPEKNAEIPSWVLSSYTASSEKEWNFSGPGFVLASNSDEIIVLEQDVHFKGSGLDLVFTSKGSDFFKVDSSASYKYWFDIVETEEAESYADYSWNLTEDGKKALSEKDVPLKFPAITKRFLNKAPVYYFAGDFADTDSTADFYKYKWLSSIADASYSFRRSDEEAFQWSVYLPVMKAIFEESHALKDSEVSSRSESVLFEKDGLEYVSKVEGKQFYVYEDGKWKEKFLKGVNIGAGKPGSFPGDLSITKREYLRWFKQIAAMNADVIRVYTTLKPDFYDALLEYNLEAEKPLYLIQGVWVKEEDKEELMDGYADNERIKNGFIADSKDLVDIIHGDAVLEEKVGFASGKYRSDVSPYVIGWLLGIEWDPYFISGTNENNPDKTSHNGEYLQTENAPPFEVFMCEVGDDVLKYEAEKYGMTRAMSISNWPTTDMLDHPNEPSPEEDMATFNMEYLKPGVKNKSGLFASYHIYPYYPEFINYQREYREFRDDDGNPNTYKAYLRDLIAQHTMPVMVAEFGVPASRGKTHDDINSGFNQGYHDETEQGNMAVSLLEDIYDEGYCGALIFTWQDEWFKRTWNTMDLNISDRRPFWSDIQTNEQYFGLLAFDPGDGKSVCYVDGDVGEWSKEDILTQNDELTLSLKSDEKYVYVMIESDGLDIEKDKIYIPIDSIQDQGNSSLGDTDLRFEKPADFLIEIDGVKNSRILVDSYYDSHYYIYGEKLRMIPQNPEYSRKDSGQFNPMRLCLSKEMYLPEDKKTIPFSDYETGKLKYGIGNPESRDYSSLVDFSSGKNNLEIRIPWQLLNVMDPSTKSIMGDFYKHNDIKAEKAEGLYFGATVLDEDTAPVSKLPMNFYTWADWEVPTYHERLKSSYPIVKDAFDRLK